MSGKKKSGARILVRKVYEPSVCLRCGEHIPGGYYVGLGRFWLCQTCHARYQEMCHNCDKSDTSVSICLVCVQKWCDKEHKCLTCVRFEKPNHLCGSCDPNDYPNYERGADNGRGQQSNIP